MSIDTLNATAPAVRIVTEAEVDREAERLIAATCARHNVTRDNLKDEVIQNAARAARKKLEGERDLANNPYYNLYQQEKAAHAATSATLGAVKQNRTIAAANDNYHHTVTAERAREMMGREEWFMCTAAQKIQAMDIEPKSVDMAQVRALFGRGADGIAAVDFQKANPKRYAALREVAKALNIYGA
jgi:hypothetical protein